ncbi:MULTISPECIES: JAB domain-containing protein [unclassified Paenibacillus]|uniref:JAB domain-containing protein n=1 Tax=unclassified Paenibacillus TaxID=185978 RepID=UPI0009FB2A47
MIINSPVDAYEVLQKTFDLESEAQEKFGIITMAIKNMIAVIHVISAGTINSEFVYPREVFKAALLNNAASMILLGNHPSGIATLSPVYIDI